MNPMANYYGFTRTNYFRVTDEDRLRKIIRSCACGEDTLTLFENAEDGERTWFGFGCYDSIRGLDLSDSADEDDYPDYDYDAFASALQKILCEGDAIIITEVGYEKLRYLTATAFIITKTDMQCLDLNIDAVKTAQEMLGDSSYNTIMEY